MRLFQRVTTAALLVFLAATAAHAADTVKGFPPQAKPADLVLKNASIVTLDPLQPHAQALAVRDRHIVAVGSDEAIANYIGDDTRVMDLHGAFVSPGFIEGHGHLMQTGRAQMQLNLGKAANWDELVAMVGAAVAKAEPGQWIIGQGWQQAKWNRKPEPAVDGLPLPDKLNAVSPDNPVILNHASGHGIYANAAALKAGGIDRDTPDPDGGEIVHDAEGNPIGMLRDAAENPVWAAYEKHQSDLSPKTRAAQREEALKRAIDNEIRKGVTTFVDMGADFDTIDWLKKQAAKGLPMRLYINVRGESVESLDKHLAEYRTIGYADNHFTVRGIGEVASDGALGTHSAWFTKPYSDAPDLSGINVVAMDRIRRIAEIAARDGFQLSVHAIGDRANHETLNLYQDIFEADPAAHNLRWRIEHAQHLLPADLPRFADMGVIASMQSIHACSDAPMVVPRIGEERAEEGAYMWHKLIASGAIVLDGTDTPVEDTNPIANYYCSVTRAYDDGDKTLFPDEAKTRLEALRAYTWNNAYAIFQEDALGSLSPGKLADMVVLSGNLLTQPAADILRTRVLYTIIDGKVVYERDGAEHWRKGQQFDPMPEFNHVN